MHESKYPIDATVSSKKEINPVDPECSKYIDDLLSRHEEPVLAEMEALAREKDFPIVERQIGAFLEVMALSIGAKRIFEFGSGFGYSAYWLTRAVGPQGRVICTDGDPTNAKLAEGFLSRLKRWDRTEYMTGWAQDSFKATDGLFDIIFNDVDKGDYPEVWLLAKERVRPAGLYIADNTLWSGRVATDTVTDDLVPGWTEAIKEHNKLISEDTDFDFFLNPARDGVIVARRRTS